MPSLRNKVDLTRYNPYGWTQAEIAIGATSSQQRERQQVHRELRTMMVEDKLSKKAGLWQRRIEKQASADKKRLEQAESSAMALEDKLAWFWRCQNYKTPEQNFHDRIDRALAMSQESTYYFESIISR